MELKFRDLRAEEIECRVGNTKRQDNRKPAGPDNPVVGFQVLLYKTARTDANVLDETVGEFNWQKRYYQVKNTMICRVGIKDKNTGDWVWKDDAGDDDFQTEQVKGEASDSFKRAGFAWGIGRKNLYYGPFIWITCNDKVNEKSKLYVSEVEYKDSIITKLVLKDRISDELVFTYPRNANVSQSGGNAPKTTISQKGTIRDNERKLILDFMKTLNEEKINQFYQWLEKKFKTSSINSLSAEEGIIVCKSWKLM